MTNQKILIVGGYGNVGRIIAEQLAPQFPAQVIVAGRNLVRARSMAAEIGHGAQARAIDISSAATTALDGVGLVVVCLDQQHVEFAERCLMRGIHYVDISAHYPFLSKVENLDGVARSAGATALLSVGVAPGLTNLLAARSAASMERVDRIDILVELGLGDSHGRMAIEWMLDNVDAEYEVLQEGEIRVVRSFSDSIVFPLPGGPARRAFRFNFSDQHVLARTLNIPSVSTWICFTSPQLTRLAARASRTWISTWLRRPLWRRLVVWGLQHLHLGSERCAVAARALGVGADGRDTSIIGIVGRNEGLMTGVVAAETIRQLLARSLAPGVYHSEQLIDLEPVVAALEREILDLEVAVWN